MYRHDCRNSRSVSALIATEALKQTIGTQGASVSSAGKVTSVSRASTSQFWVPSQQTHTGRSGGSSAMAERITSNAGAGTRAFHSSKREASALYSDLGTHGGKSSTESV
mmetsp:Transcript_24188/g.38742  ORF Transcript_24188/g.38742 Transcript_24188/m.38742 type:complete len:109 (+) Transcript_24188:569-895(+)